jgi:hypothetical protein
MVPLEITKSLVQQFVLWPLGLWHGVRSLRPPGPGDLQAVIWVLALSALTVAPLFLWLNLRSRTARKVYGRWFWPVSVLLVLLPWISRFLWPEFWLALWFQVWFWSSHLLLQL